MIKIHRARLFNEVKDSGAPLGRFYTDIQDFDENKKGCFVIRVRGTPLEFRVCQKQEEYLYSYQKTQFAPESPLSPWFGDRERNKYDIDEICDYLQDWIEYVVQPYLEEETIEDPWEQLGLYQQLIPSSAFTKEDLQPFSPEEKEHYRIALKSIKLLIYENSDPNEEQKVLIEERLDYLINALDRLNRFDWKGLAVSVIVSIGINLSFDTETGKMLLGLLQQAFNAAQHLLK